MRLDRAFELVDRDPGALERPDELRPLDVARPEEASVVRMDDARGDEALDPRWIGLGLARELLERQLHAPMLGADTPATCSIRPGQQGGHSMSVRIVDWTTLR